LKIESSGVLDHVHDYVLTNTNKADCINKIFSRNEQGERQLTFVDDRPDQLEKVQERYPDMFIYRMKRIEGRYGELLTLKSIPEIKKLTTILK
jgi:predicted enzyme involved in methoxymalonyl-ACP biosynthesis